MYSRWLSVIVKEKSFTVQWNAVVRKCIHKRVPFDRLCLRNIGEPKKNLNLFNALYIWRKKGRKSRVKGRRRNRKYCIRDRMQKSRLENEKKWKEKVRDEKIA